MNSITLKTVFHDSAKLFAFNFLICSAKLDTLLPSLMCQEKQAVTNQNEAQPTGDLKPVEQPVAQQFPTEAAKAQENFEQVKLIFWALSAHERLLDFGIGIV
jgi:hypothetical protein